MEGHLCEDTEEILSLTDFDPATSGRLVMIIEAAGELKQQLPDAVVKVPVSGPFSLASNLCGLENLLCDCMTDPDIVFQCLEKLTVNQLSFVEAIRAAEFIANVYDRSDLKMSEFNKAARAEIKDVLGFLGACEASEKKWRSVRSELQDRMSRAGAHIRSLDELKAAVKEAKAQLDALEEQGCKALNAVEKVQALRNRQLCFAHWVYLAATLYSVKSGVGSRGSAMVRDASGQRAHKQLAAEEWSFLPEDPAFKEKVQETVVTDGKIKNRWVKCRPIPESNLWFETAWADYRNGKIYT